MSDTVKLGQLVSILSGFAFKSDSFSKDEGMPIIRIRDVVRGYSDTKYTGSYSQDYVVNVGDLLIGMDGNFNTARWQSEPALLNQRVCKIVANEKLLDENYLFHFLPPALKKIEDSTSFVTVKHLSVKDIRDIEIPLPPLPEQRRIAAILDQADQLRVKRREALAELDRLTQSIFVEMFGDPVTNSKDWPRVKFSSLLENIDSGWSPVCMDRPAHGDEWGVLKLGALTSCEYKDGENKALPHGVAFDPKIEVKTGDLLFTRKNTYNLVAACTLVNKTRERLMLSDLMFRFQLKSNAKVERQYLQSLLVFPSKRTEVQKLAGGSSGSMPNISKGRLLELDIELPPLAIQQSFAQRFQFVKMLKDRQHMVLSELDTLFTSLQHRAFRGEL